MKCKDCKFWAMRGEDWAIFGFCYHRNMLAKTIGLADKEDCIQISGKTQSILTNKEFGCVNFQKHEKV